jgi:hypothetical protein
VTGQPEPLTVFVNERPVRVPRGAGAADAARVHDPTLAEPLTSGQAYLTDGRGIRIDPDTPLTPGDIIRVIVRSRRAEPHADA